MYAYGFSHAIKMGQIPYKDFNTIVTPLYFFICSIGLQFFDDLIMFNLEQSIMVTIMFYFIFKILDKKAYIILLFMCLFSYNGFVGTYNFCCLLLIIMIIYIEKTNNNRDYLIGFLIGLMILSKQSVGLFFLIPSLTFYYKNIKKICKRFLGLIIPIVIFISYLIVNRALFQFINLCFLGMFDFGNKNTYFLNIWFLLTLFGLIVTIYFLIKKPKNIICLYAIMSVSFCIPIFNGHHFVMFFIIFLIVFLSFVHIRDYYCYLSIFVTILISILFMCLLFDRGIILQQFNHLNYNLSFKIDNYMNIKFNKVINKYNNGDSNNTIVMTYSSIYYAIINDKKITYFDVLNYGNYGYEGSIGMVKRLKKLHNKYVIINMHEYYLTNNKLSQFDKYIAGYIMKNYKLLEDGKYYRVYYID